MVESDAARGPATPTPPRPPPCCTGGARESRCLGREGLGLPALASRVSPSSPASPAASPVPARAAASAAPSYSDTAKRTRPQYPRATRHRQSLSSDQHEYDSPTPHVSQRQHCLSSVIRARAAGLYAVPVSSIHGVGGRMSAAPHRTSIWPSPSPYRPPAVGAHTRCQGGWG